MRKKSLTALALACLAVEEHLHGPQPHLHVEEGSSEPIARVDVLSSALTSVQGSHISALPDGFGVYKLRL